MARTVTAQVDDQIAMVERRMQAVHLGVAQDLKEEIQLPISAGGKMRVDTGFLRASLQLSMEAMPDIDQEARPPDDAAKGSFQPDDGLDVILAAGIDDTIYMGFTAAYARAREVKDGFVETAVLNLQTIVDLHQEKAKAAFPDP